ncbi:sensor histidine kinase [Microbacterium sp. NPDC058342]|uniref:sensor histidine kinase n=1 Tax=Microbacterium sp. NPDC058342 TaxID=3346454 RepID=UPI003650A096
MVQRLTAMFAEGDVDPQRLVRVIGETLRARWCEFTIGSRRYEWSAPARRSDEAASLQLRSDPDIAVAVAPRSAMLEARHWQPLLVLLEPLAFTEAAEQEQRTRRDVVQRLDDARWRASVEMAQERRRLERDLHDGAQHHLVALQMAIAMAEHHKEDPGKADRRDAVRTHLESVERVLVATARGVLPRILAAEGLNGALQALAGANLSVSSRLPRLMPAVESALYFIALEAVSNAQKHAPGARVAVDAWMRDGRVTISIRDDGPGFVVNEDGVGGLSHLADRLEAIDGVLEVESVLGRGTCITASVRS